MTKEFVTEIGFYHHHPFRSSTSSQLLCNIMHRLEAQDDFEHPRWLKSCLYNLNIYLLHVYPESEGYRDPIPFSKVICRFCSGGTWEQQLRFFSSEEFVRLPWVVGEVDFQSIAVCVLASQAARRVCQRWHQLPGAVAVCVHLLQAFALVPLPGSPSQSEQTTFSKSGWWMLMVSHICCNGSVSVNMSYAIYTNWLIIITYDCFPLVQLGGIPCSTTPTRNSGPQLQNFFAEKGVPGSWSPWVLALATVTCAEKCHQGLQICCGLGSESSCVRFENLRQLGLDLKMLG